MSYEEIAKIRGHLLFFETRLDSLREDDVVKRRATQQIIDNFTKIINIYLKDQGEEPYKKGVIITKTRGVYL
jgi:hypothetical protein